MRIEDCNPFVRVAMLQPRVFEGTRLRSAYDHRLFLVLAGEGRLVTASGETALTPDTLLLLPPAFAYHFKGNMRMAVLNFDLSRRAAHQKQPLFPPDVPYFLVQKVFDAETLEAGLPFVGKCDVMLRQEVLDIVEHFASDDPLSDAATSAMLKRMLAELLRTARYESPTKELVRRVRRYIEGNAVDIVDNNEIAHALGYHPVYLATVFKAETGETLHHAVLARRVQLACRWLTGSDSSIEEIAFKTGFSSRSHFCTAFRAMTGYSPRAFRQMSEQQAKE